jgi:H+-transporting ATPase
MYVGVAASALVAAYAIMIKTDPLVILTFAVIFLMGAIPVALPAVLSIVQSVGAVELSRKGVLVSRLEAIEDMASIDTLCFDKTGTLTKNELAVADLSPMEGISKDELLVFAGLACASANPDLIDATILAEAASRSLALDGYRQLSFTPFDPLTKRTEAIAVAPDGRRLRLVKGAFDAVLGSCAPIGPGPSLRVESQSAKGYRSIAVAVEEEGATLRLAGILALSDPPREDSRSMIEELKSLGIRPVMLTGDGAPIAAQVARKVGIGDRIIRADEFARMDDVAIASLIEKADGVAGVFPDNKYSVIHALQARGHRTGMTGDGVNDAPALHQAEVGIAVYGATDVAKASASLILTEPGLAVIVHAVETSRQIYQRMLSWVINKVTKVLSFTGFLAVAFVWLRELPLSLLGMSLLVFSNDFATMSIATDRVVHTTEPNRWEVKTIIKASVIPSLGYMLQALGALALGVFAFRLGPDRLKTLVLLDLVFSSQFRVLSVRERGHMWDSLPGKALLRTSALVVAVFAVLGIAGVLIPALSLPQVLAILAYAAVVSIATDWPKCLAFRRYSL